MIDVIDLIVFLSGQSYAIKNLYPNEGTRDLNKSISIIKLITR